MLSAQAETSGEAEGKTPTASYSAPQSTLICLHMVPSHLQTPSDSQTLQG